MINSLIRCLLIIVSINLMANAQETERAVPPPAPPPAPTKMSGGVLNGKAIELPAPVFPAEARAMNLAGTVSVQVVINESGVVTSATAIRGPEPLWAVAQDAALRARFSPTTLAGVPVKVVGVIEYNFTNPEATGLSEEETKHMWAFGAVMSFAREDDESIYDFFGGRTSLDSLIEELSNDLPPAFAPQRALFEKVASSSGDERASAVEELLPKFKESLTNDQQWQVDAGVAVGNLMISITHSSNAFQDSGVLETESIRERLNEVAVIVAHAPTNSSNEFLDKLRLIAEFASRPIDPPTVNELVARFQGLISLLPD